MSERVRVPPVDDPDFVADVRHGEPSELLLVGSADAAASAPLGKLLDELDAELIERAATRVVVDMRGLDFMSAAAFKQILLWIGRLGDRETGRYQIVIRSNPTIAWQRHTLRALGCFDTSTISVEVS